MAKVIVLLVGLLVIGFIVWWFFGKHTTQTVQAQGDQEQTVAIEVNGGYSPEQVILKQGIPAVLKFTRKDASSEVQEKS